MTTFVACADCGCVFAAGRRVMDCHRPDCCCPDVPQHDGSPDFQSEPPHRQPGAAPSVGGDQRID